MAADNSHRSSFSDEQNQNPNPKVNDDEDLEEGEIINESDSSNNIPKEIETKHLLENSWTFWYDHQPAKSKQGEWGINIRPVYTFSSIEEFWGLYNNVRHPSSLTSGADFHCFKEKIVPKWEDPICANGGKWTMTFPKGKSDTAWLYTLLAMIGEQFDHGDEICGAVVNVRAKQEKIAIWTKNAANEAAQTSIGEQWKKFLDYKESIGYITHEDAKVMDRGAKSIYTA